MVATSKLTPQFKHNCENCVCVGFEKGRDYYWCPPPPGAPGEGMLTVRWGGNESQFQSMPVCEAKTEKGHTFLPFQKYTALPTMTSPFKKALALKELSEQKISMTIELSDTVQFLLSDVMLPKREMGLEEKLLLQNFLTKRMLREYKGVQLTPTMKIEIRESLEKWLQEWELIRS